MAQYLKVSSPVGGSCNNSLKRAITYIGTRYGKLANKNGRTNKEYFKGGRDFVAKRFGAFRKTAINHMVMPKKIKNSKNRHWRYHKRIYDEAYGYIIDLLLKCPPDDKNMVKGLLDDLHQDICVKSGEGNGLARHCSNALLFWQKDMLELHKISRNISDDDKEVAGKILVKIVEVDKPLP